MNDKTAKLIRKYSRVTEEKIADLKRRWYDMDSTERRDFRVKMKETVGKGPAQAE